MKDFKWSKFSASSSPSTIISDCLVFFPVLELLESAMTWQHHLQHSYVPSLPDCREALENLTQVWARGSKNKITQQEYRFFFSFFLKHGTIQASLATSEHMGISHATSFLPLIHPGHILPWAHPTDVGCSSSCSALPLWSHHCVKWCWLLSTQSYRALYYSPFFQSSKKKKKSF